MKSVELVALIIKLSSIFLGLSMLQEAAGVVYLFSGEFGIDAQSATYRFVYLGIVLIGFVLAFIFWNFPVSVAKWFLPTSSDQNYPEIELKRENLEIILYSAIGVYLIAVYLPDLSYDILYLILIGEADSEFEQVGRSIKESALEILYSGACVLIGFLLAAYSGNVKKLLSKIRGRT